MLPHAIGDKKALKIFEAIIQKHDENPQNFYECHQQGCEDTVSLLIYMHLIAFRRIIVNEGNAVVFGTDLSGTNVAVVFFGGRITRHISLSAKSRAARARLISSFKSYVVQQSAGDDRQSSFDNDMIVDETETTDAAYQLAFDRFINSLDILVF